MSEFSDLLGVTLARVEGSVVGSEEISFVGADDRRWRMRHYQDCCENVAVEEIHGDVDDLIGSPILRAEESANSDIPPERHDESFTWTFYKLATIKGEVVIRWYGESNGYYATDVYFDEIEPATIRPE